MNILKPPSLPHPRPPMHAFQNVCIQTYLLILFPSIHGHHIFDSGVNLAGS